MLYITSMHLVNEHGDVFFTLQNAGGFISCPQGYGFHREHVYVFFIYAPKNGPSRNPDNRDGEQLGLIPIYRDHANAFIIGHE